MKYKTYNLENKISLLEVGHDQGLKVVFCPVGASIKTIYLDDVQINTSPKNAIEFLNSNYGKTSGPNVLDKPFTSKGKTYTKNEDGKKYNCSNFIYEAKPYLDKNIFSITYFFKKKKMADGFPGNVSYYVTYSLNDSQNVLLVDYRAITDEITPISISNTLSFNLGDNDINNIKIELPDCLTKEDNAEFYNGLENNQIIKVENRDYRVEIEPKNYAFLKVAKDQADNACFITPIDNPNKNNIVVRGETYQRQIIYRFIKK